MIKAYAAMAAGQPLAPYEYEPGPLQPTRWKLTCCIVVSVTAILSVLDNEWGFSQYPVVAGHEVIGVVSALGSQVSRHQLGDYVGLGWHSGYCQQCAFCDSGDHNLCSKAQPTISGHHGGFADKVRASANSLVAIPKGVDLASAGPLLCGGLPVFNPLVQFGIKPTNQVAVIGIGGLGHLALQFLRAWGCNVTAFTSSEASRQEALTLGAHHHAEFQR